MFTTTIPIAHVLGEFLRAARSRPLEIEWQSEPLRCRVLRDFDYEGTKYAAGKWSKMNNDLVASPGQQASFLPEVASDLQKKGLVSVEDAWCDIGHALDGTLALRPWKDALTPVEEDATFDQVFLAVRLIANRQLIPRVIIVPGSTLFLPWGTIKLHNWTLSSFGYRLGATLEILDHAVKRNLSHVPATESTVWDEFSQSKDFRNDRQKSLS